MLLRLKVTIDDKRIIGAKRLAYVYTCIDAAYLVHSDTTIPTVGPSQWDMEWSKKYSAKRLNTKISTEVELVDVSEYLPYNLWLILFLHGQGYDIMNNIVYQDNQRAIRMG